VKLSRLRSSDDLPRWQHPNGWRIVKRERDWSLRGFERGTAGVNLAAAPRTWYEVTSLGATVRSAPIVHSGVRLRDVRAWCDLHRKNLEGRPVSLAETP
jgi:hypothetical protein